MAKSSGGAMTVMTGKLAGMVGYRIANSKTPQGFREYRGVISNPQTAGQRVQRARFATVVAAAAQISDIVDHSFEGVNGATLNRGRFVRENIAIMKGRTYDFLNKNEHRMSANPFVISNGTLAPVMVIEGDTISAGEVGQMQAIKTTLDVANIATATPATIFPNYVAGVQCTVLFVRYKRTDLTVVGEGASASAYPNSTYVDKARFCFNPNSDAPCFLAVDGATGVYTLNPAALNSELSLNEGNLYFKVVDGALVIGHILTIGTTYTLYGGAVIMSERTSASHRYSRATMWNVDFITGTSGVYTTVGNPIERAQATFQNGGSGEVFASDQYLNNADNE